MGLDVYFRRDIGNILHAAAATHLGATGTALNLLEKVGAASIRQQDAIQFYRAGFLQALLVVGLAVDLEPSDGATIPQIERGQVAIPSWVERRQR